MSSDTFYQPFSRLYVTLLGISHYLIYVEEHVAHRSDYWEIRFLRDVEINSNF